MKHNLLGFALSTTFLLHVLSQMYFDSKKRKINEHLESFIDYFSYTSLLDLFRFLRGKKEMSVCRDLSNTFLIVISFLDLF